ncbi:MAG: hypothetical protein EB075_10085 [Bacteroidetes bacterium]|nr:hypothetical protein [Bacteroidota bacterium]
MINKPKLAAGRYAARIAESETWYRVEGNEVYAEDDPTQRFTILEVDGGQVYLADSHGQVTTHAVAPLPGEAHTTYVQAGLHSYEVDVRTALERQRANLATPAASTSGGDARVVAHMPGLVLTVHVTPGQRITCGDPLVILEAMKMENEISARADGVVSVVHVSAGETVAKGAVMVEIEPLGEAPTS